MRDFVYTNKSIEECYVCKACEQICPKNAITMSENEEGFQYPHIDTSKCVDCGLCQCVCPTQMENISVLFHVTPQTVSAAWNPNLSERLESTSGGMFFLLACQFINERGVVYGADYREDLTVFHCRFDDSEALKRARGSKYVQSDINDTFLQVRTDLKNGRKVLFSGTPCQIAGLRLFLRKPYDNLFTIDLVCHGVPSPFFFKKNLTFLEKEYGDHVVDFKFRAKKKSGWRSYVKYVFNQRKPIWDFLGKNYYTHAFHLGYFNRASCYTCDFSRSERVGDITLSDFWGAEKHCRSLKKARKWGFNLVMCNTPQGRSLYETVLKYVESMECPVEWAIQGDVRLRHTEQRPGMRDKAYKLLSEKGYAYMSSVYGIKESLPQRLIPAWAKNLIREIQSRI